MSDKDIARRRAFTQFCPSCQGFHAGHEAGDKAIMAKLGGEDISFQREEFAMLFLELMNLNATVPMDAVEAVALPPGAKVH